LDGRRLSEKWFTGDRNRSAATDGVDDFNLVAGIYNTGVKGAAWHDFPVYLQGQTFVRQAK
jgi:hypothetical protein